MRFSERVRDAVGERLSIGWLLSWILAGIKWGVDKQYGDDAWKWLKATAMSQYIGGWGWFWIGQAVVVAFVTYRVVSYRYRR